MAYELKDYVEVPERIRAWYERHEDGRIVCELVSYSEALVVVKASVYRTSDPATPPAGVGHSSLTIPGKTPYTRDSELENAETSAAGRALVMAGIPAKSVDSGAEVRSKQAGPSSPARESESTAYGEGATGSGSLHQPCGGTWVEAAERPGWLVCNKCEAFRKDRG